MLQAQAMSDVSTKSHAAKAMDEAAKYQNASKYLNLNKEQKAEVDLSLEKMVGIAITKDQNDASLKLRDTEQERIQNKLMELDAQEKLSKISGPEALAQRIPLEQELAAIQKTYADSLDKQQNPAGWMAANKQYFQDMMKLNTDLKKQFDESPLGGFTTALQSYASQATNLGAQVSSVTTKMFKGMEDALVSFVEKGKFNFNQFASSIISDLIRIMVQQSITGPLAGLLGGTSGGSNGASSGLLGSLFSGLGSMSGLGGMFSSSTPLDYTTVNAGAGVGPLLDAAPYSAGSAMAWLTGGGIMRAAGGTAIGGSTVLVGENGPELFTPGATGVVTPNHALGGSNDLHMNVSIDARGADAGVEAKINAAMNQAVDRAQAAVLSNMRRGGTMARAAGVRS